MAVDYDSFTAEEKDNFVRNLLTEDEIKAAVVIMRGRKGRDVAAEEILEFCFKLAGKKMDDLAAEIRRKREGAEK